MLTIIELLACHPIPGPFFIFVFNHRYHILVRQLVLPTEPEPRRRDNIFFKFYLLETYIWKTTTGILKFGKNISLHYPLNHLLFSIVKTLNLRYFVPYLVILVSGVKDETAHFARYADFLLTVCPAAISGNRRNTT